MMAAAPLPADEVERLAELSEYAILDTPPEPAFDGLVQLVARIFQVPIGLVTLVDDDRQWFKAKIGLDVQETARDHAFCAHAILRPNDVLVVEDAQADVRFSDNPLVTSDPNIRFYAGAPLRTPSGRAVGSLCAIDREPRTFSDEQIEALRILSEQVSQLLELRRKSRLLEKNERYMAAVLDAMDEGLVVTDRDHYLLSHNRRAMDLLRFDLNPIVGYPLSAAYRAALDARGEEIALDEGLASRSLRARGHGDARFQLLRRDGSAGWFEANTTTFDDPMNGIAYVTSFRDIDERLALEEALRAQAATDSLTGLLNRRHFMLRLEQAIATAQRQGSPLTVSMIDMDRFKLVNDTYGHAAGDAGLKHLAIALTSTVRTDDVVARLGGDEFAVIFPNASEAQASECMQRVRDRLYTEPLHVDDANAIRLEASFGAASWRAGMSPDDIMKAADRRLYEAKAARTHPASA